MVVLEGEAGIGKKSDESYPVRINPFLPPSDFGLTERSRRLDMILATPPPLAGVGTWAAQRTDRLLRSEVY